MRRGKEVMKGLGIVTICVIASFFAAGCAHQKDSLPKASESAAAVQSENYGSMVCLLDATAAYSVEKVEPVPAPVDGTSPAIEVPETSFDFGKISEEQDLVHTFSVRNVGTSVLNIRKVVPG
jgi:hypothetical protein